MLQIFISTSSLEMRSLFLNKKNTFFPLLVPKESMCAQIPFLCSLVWTFFLATFRVYTFRSKVPFGNITYFRILHCPTLSFSNSLLVDICYLQPDLLVMLSGTKEELGEGSLQLIREHVLGSWSNMEWNSSQSLHGHMFLEKVLPQNIA